MSGIKDRLEKRRKTLLAFILGWTLVDISVARDEQPGLILLLRKPGAQTSRQIQISFAGNPNDDRDYGICAELWEFADEESSDYCDELTGSKGPIVSYRHDLDPTWAKEYCEYIKRLASSIKALLPKGKGRVAKD